MRLIRRGRVDRLFHCERHLPPYRSVPRPFSTNRRCLRQPRVRTSPSSLSFHTRTHSPSLYSVVAITTYSAILSSPDAPRDKFRNTQSASGGGSWFTTLLKWIGFLGVVGGLAFAYRKYNLQQRGLGGARFAGSGFGSSGGFGGGGLGAFDSKRF